jgi:hypothetical protein
VGGECDQMCSRITCSDAEGALSPKYSTARTWDLTALHAIRRDPEATMPCDLLLQDVDYFNE